ncbi:hypothetical protein C8R46DRAFT_1235889 [Mycena filopes]|nr:hypothetical protein C8R46DRAFT_1235889 [Mycena filopes]
MPIGEQNNGGVAGAAKGVTSTVGNLVGGVSKTVGGVVGAAGEGLGNTVNSTTGTKQGGDAIKDLTGGVNNAAESVGKGFENAGLWKK